MHEIRVWAPRVSRVEVLLNRRRIPAASTSEGWWTASVAGTEWRDAAYGFFLDGTGPFSDPRSPWQPEGVDGLSRFVDHEAFQWTDANWCARPLPSAIFYELHIGTFTPAGTFLSAIERLDHLVRLGITHVELMPVNQFAGERGWGYDGVALFAPYHNYGTPDDLKRFVDACHARQLAVILDVVYNHLGAHGNHLNRFGPYFNTTYSTFWGAALNFDSAGSNEVRRFFCDNAVMWLRDYHFDGLRIDAVHAILDVSAESFLGELSAEIAQLSAHLARPLVLIAESDLNDPRLMWPVAHGGSGMDAQWLDDFHHSLHAVLTGENAGYYRDFGSVAHLAKALTRGYVYDGIHSEHRKRRHGRPAHGLDAHCFVAYLQNHDQVGNRAQGERSCQLMPAGRAKIGAAILLLSPFIPLLFQGEDWAASTPFFYFADPQLPELQHAVREGRKREFSAFNWPVEKLADPIAPDTFERSKLNWSELETPTHREMSEWHRRLIQLRRSEPCLADGRLARVNVTHGEDEPYRLWLVMQREAITVACNLGSRTHSIPLPAGRHQLVMSSSLTSDGVVQSHIDLPADSVAVLKITTEPRKTPDLGREEPRMDTNERESHP